MSSDLDVFKAIVDAFERSDWTEIDVSSGPLRIHLSTQPQPDAGAAPVIPPGPPAPETGNDPGDGTNTADSPDGGPAKGATISAGAHVVLSPSPGIFWRSPQPGDPPFADDGTWGWDFRGGLIQRKVILNWWHGRRYQGGVGAYGTDREKLLPRE